MSSRRTGVAVVGCGDISDQYLTNLLTFPDVEVVFCADLDAERAKSKAAEYGVAGHGSLDEALADPRVEVVVNLTVPAAHAAVATQAIEAGRHVWNEKPLTADLVSSRALTTLADNKGLRLGCAPDTVLGAGIQTARRLIDAGAIGEPIAANVALQTMGPDQWHPDPETFFRAGAGPLFDMGPYYFSTMCLLLGPVRLVSALARTGRDRRQVRRGPRIGETFPVEVPTHLTAIIEFASGPTMSAVFSFDSALRRTGVVEITGTEGTLVAPDPNAFDGSSFIHRPGAATPEEVQAVGTTAGRGIGVVDLVQAIGNHRRHRAAADLAVHVLKIMSAIEESAANRSTVELLSTFDPIDPVDPTWDPTVRGR